MTPTSLVTARGANAARSSTHLGAVPMGADGVARGDGLPSQSANRSRHASLAFKQVFDFAAAGILVVLSAPLFLLIALAIRLSSPGPVFFVQERVGQQGRRFRFFKFRTMLHNADDTVHREFSRNFICGSNGSGKVKVIDSQQNEDRAHPVPFARRGNGHSQGNGNGNGHADGNGRQDAVVYKMTEDPRVTRIGKLLRRTSLDELPQLLNVVRGEMSLVGPRPPVVYELDHYQDWHKQRLSAKPGITGLWQVSGRSSVPFDEMVLLDLHYIENRSMAMDLRIILKTLPVMLKGEGAY